MFTTKPAAHRVQNTSHQIAVIRQKEELRGDVSTYLDWRQLQADAVEDDELSLACSIGKSMRQLREKHDQKKWIRELNRQDTAEGF